jgi:hypothetical protein
MLLNKEILTGLYSSTKNINFNISWYTGSITVTAYNPPQNENDRPRINTWRSDATYVVYMSAGNAVEDPATHAITYPWGNRSLSAQQLTIPVRSSAGVDLFTEPFVPVPNLIPSTSNWNKSNTGNGTEQKYQYVTTKVSARDQFVSIQLDGFWNFTKPAVTKTVTSFSVTTVPAGEIIITWGDSLANNTLTSGGLVNHTYVP